MAPARIINMSVIGDPNDWASDAIEIPKLFSHVFKAISLWEPTKSRKLRVLAARYLIGAETNETLDHMLGRHPYRSTGYCDVSGELIEHYSGPMLLPHEVAWIKSLAL